MRVPCPGCGGLFDDAPGPVHAYVPSSPGCWRVFGEVQAFEMAQFGYPSVHRLVVDAYMAQHPGDGSDRRDRQSVFVHLVAICAVLEQSMYPPDATALFRRVLRDLDEIPVLTREEPGALTVHSMVGARDLPDYEERARAWAQAVWDAWAGEHDRIRAALAAAG